MLRSMHARSPLRTPKDSWLLHGGAVRRRLVMAAWPGLAELAAEVERAVAAPRRRPDMVPVPVRIKA
jgi:hypothetical protein